MNQQFGGPHSHRAWRQTDAAALKPAPLPSPAELACSRVRQGFGLSTSETSDVGRGGGSPRSCAAGWGEATGAESVERLPPPPSAAERRPPPPSQTRVFPGLGNNESSKVGNIRLCLGRWERPSERHGEAGFTLVEILVVITIIGLIMGLVGPRVLNYLGESKVKAAHIQIQSFGSALDLFYLDNGRYPSSGEGLGALVQRPGGSQSWNGPYLKGAAVPADPWGHSYVYRSPGEHGPYDIASYGADGQEGGTGTAADVTNWSN